MKLVSFAFPAPGEPEARIGCVVVDRVLDLRTAHAWSLIEQGAEPAAARRLAESFFPADMVNFLELGEVGMRQARALVEAFASRPEAEVWADPGRHPLLSPLPRAASLRDFLAFEAHVRRGYERRGQPFPDLWYEFPVYYKGHPRSFVAPDDEVPWPSSTERFDYELELACVIGRRGRDIPVERAHEYIAGYCILNDFSARDVQMREVQLRLGPAKGKDFATGLGPWLVTPDELSDARDLEMVARVNGEEWSRGNSGTSHWTFAQMIAHASRDETLFPGDILGSGTVGGGCGYELDRWLEPGDLVELEITGLGRLRHRVGPRPAR